MLLDRLDLAYGRDIITKKDGFTKPHDSWFIDYNTETLVPSYISDHQTQVQKVLQKIDAEVSTIQALLQDPFTQR